MADRHEDLRRAARLPSRCRVEVRDRFACWSAETADIGPRGCRLDTPRAANVGQLLRLSVESEHLSERLHVLGQVVWSTARPLRAGLSFAGVTAAGLAPRAWVERLFAVELARAIRGGAVDAAGRAVVCAGGPPPADLGARELAVLRRVGKGAPLSDVLREASAAGVVVSLLTRGLLTLSRETEIEPEAWRRAVGGIAPAGPRPAPREVIVPPPPGGLPGVAEGEGGSLHDAILAALAAP